MVLHKARSPRYNSPDVNNGGQVDSRLEDGQKHVAGNHYSDITSPKNHEGRLILNFIDTELIFKTPKMDICNGVPIENVQEEQDDENR